MDEMASSEFRKRYASLREPVTVTVNGHVIGAWFPGTPAQHFDPMIAKGELPWKSPAVGVTQKQRDDLLRKINRSR